MKYWLADRQPGHTFNDGQHFWCWPTTKTGLRSVMMTKTKYKSRVIISPVLSFLLRNPDIYGVTFNTFNGQFAPYFMGSTIKLNCCAALVCISPSHTISQLKESCPNIDIFIYYWQSLRLSHGSSSTSYSSPSSSSLVLPYWAMILRSEGHLSIEPTQPQHLCVQCMTDCPKC